MQRVKQGKEAKKSSKKTVFNENTAKTGKIFGDWTFERLEEEFGLNGRKALFCARYAAHEVGNKAAVEAGYSANSAATKASTLLCEVNIRAAVAALLKAKRDNIADSCGVTAEWIVENFKKVFLHCSSIREKEDENGNASANMIYPDGSLRALEDLAKIAGVIDPKGKAQMPDANAQPVTRVMIVRESASADEWEKKLLAQQETLLNGN